MNKPAVLIIGAFTRIGRATATASFPVMLMLRGRLSIQEFGLPSTTRDDAKLAALRTFVTQGLDSGAREANHLPNISVRPDR